MYYHASQTADLQVLEPRISNHNASLIYFSTKRENTLVYLCNAIEKHCKEIGFAHNGKWHKWAPYGFETDGIMRIDEYYPNGIEETYKGVSGYIYSVDAVLEEDISHNISDVVATNTPVPVCTVEFIEDAFIEIQKATADGLIRIRRYEEMSDEMLSWIEKTIRSEYKEAEDKPDYKCFLKAKFEFL